MPAKRTVRQFITTGAAAAVGFSLFPTLRIDAESIGAISPEQGATTIDAAGKMVNPGFTDARPGRALRKA